MTRWSLNRGVHLIEASAGTGKTYTITNLVVLAVAEQNVPIDKVLALTFTTTATAQLKHETRARLRLALTALREGAPKHDAFLVDFQQRHQGATDASEWVPRLRQALIDFDSATIYTIHSFCQRALATHAVACDVEPQTELTGGTKPLITSMATDYWVAHTWNLPPEIYRWLIKAAAARKLSAKILLDTGEITTQAPLARVTPLAGPLTPPNLDAFEAARAAAREAWTSKGTEALALIAASPVMNRPYNHPGKLAEAVDKVQAWLDGVLPGQRLTKVMTKLTSEAVLAGHKKNKQPDMAMVEHEVFTSQQALADACVDLKSSMEAFAQAFFSGFHATLQDRLVAHGQRQHSHTYRDLLIDLYHALQGSQRAQLSARLRDDYQVALIDEFQDTDPVQWAILGHLFGGGTHPTYLVGDEKQSIYNFRGADVFAYRMARKQAGKPTSLGTNWRSDAPLVHAVNHLFARIDEPFMGAGGFAPVTPQHPRRLHFAGEPERPPFEIRVLQREDPEDCEPVSTTAAALCARAALDIHALLQHPPMLDIPGGQRPITAFDIAVLVRTHQHGKDVQAALGELGIPSVRHEQGNVLESSEAVELHRVLSALLQPRRRDVVGTALVSPLIGLTALEVVTLYGDDRAYDEMLGRLRRWATLWQREGVLAALRACFASQDVPARVLATPEGVRSLTNYRHLLELLNTAERAHQLSPGALLHWLKTAGGSMGADDVELRLVTDDDAVRIVTIHTCKGLQYPVVFCPDLWKEELLQADEKRALRYHDNQDATVLDLTLAKPAKHAGVVQGALEHRAEGMRLAYVALTRAQHRCVVYWGPLGRTYGSALAYLLHQPDGGPAPSKKDLNRILSLNDADFLEEVRRAQTEHIAVTTLPTQAVWPEVSEHATTGSLPFDPYTRKHLDSWWRVTSFSKLSGHHGSTAKKATTTEDATSLPESMGVNRDPEDDEAPEAEVDELATAVLAPFDRGRNAGDCMHKILELHDFTQEPELGELVRVWLLHYGYDPDGVKEDLTHAERLTQGLALALRATLPGAEVPLAAVPMADRLDELPFHLRVPGAVAAGEPAPPEGVTAKQIAEVLAAHPTPSLDADYFDSVRRLKFFPLCGFLHGKIDLVFRSGGRWYLADYKSTWLGVHASDYTVEAMTRKMADYHYFLQYLIYAVALHRFLQQRQAGYRFAEHFGGVYYLFLRGMAPGATTGIFFERPSESLIVGLSSLFDPGGRT